MGYTSLYGSRRAQGIADSQQLVDRSFESEEFNRDLKFENRSDRFLRDFLDAEFDKRIRLDWSGRRGYNLIVMKNFCLDVRRSRLLSPDLRKAPASGYSTPYTINAFWICDDPLTTNSLLDYFGTCQNFIASYKQHK